MAVLTDAPARLGIISGTGSYSWPLTEARDRPTTTAYGEVPLTVGRLGDVVVVHLSRHGAGHQRLSSSVHHKANLAALLDAGVTAVVSLTVCGAVDPALPLGSLIVFDDLHFPSNRLPDGSLCTWYDEPGDPRRGHWILGDPFSADLRSTLLDAAADVGLPLADGGCYGHVDGPRFNTRSEIRALAAAGVSAVSQTGGPEAVLAGEAELPFALVGFTTDYANGIAEPEPVSALLSRLADSSGVFAMLVAAAAARIGDAKLRPAGVMYRFDA